MPDPFRFADELGPLKIVHIHRPAVGLKAVVAVDNVACGPAIGGCRMAPDVSAEEAFRLARAMTFKNAAAGLAHGGGKSVIFGDPRMQTADKERLIRAFAGVIADVTDYIVGPDMGTDELCMGWVKDEIGRAVGLPREIGGIPLDEIGATGLGLAAAIDAAKDAAEITLKGARVAVQGFGAVGKHAARFLAERGAILVAASDTTGTLADADGLDIAALIRLKAEGRKLYDHPRGKKLDRDAIIDAECDIWIPAARPDVIRADNVARLRTRLVAQGANIPFTPEAEAQLHKRGILVLPDFIANAGGVICAAVEYHGGTESAALATIVEKIAANTHAVLDEVKRTGALPRAAAVALAERRVRAAMATHRWR
ncbi:MAG TPA: Glu/Leu/Phe/Val dehydrogenase [Alphaproteobacteria bacterium]|nr:Glu/Leu/Phe/Val dehydrogenase [Alphaproteobacteria bacterium]